MSIINIKEIESYSPFFKSKLGSLLSGFIMKVCSIDKINEVYDHSVGYTGPEFAGRLLNDLGVNYIIGNSRRLTQLPEGAFITISNHPYGGLDGIILVDLMARIRSDYKLMVNSMLAMVKTMNENFISVEPTGNKKSGVSGKNLKAIRNTLNHLKEGHPMGFFPSGAVSDFSLRDLYIRDRVWQESILHLIHSVKVPVLPIRFFDNNSPFFYFLGMINWKIRSFRMPSELFNKRKHEQRIGIGDLLSVKELEQFSDTKSLGIFLRKAVYGMPEPSSYIPRNFLNVTEHHLEIITA
jgi:putative hemolysin